MTRWKCVSTRLIGFRAKVVRRQILLMALLLATLAGGSGLIFPQGRAAENQSLQEKWLQAETESERSRSIALLENLYAETAGKEIAIADGISAGDVSRRLWTAYIESGDLAKAQKLCGQWPPRERIYALILLARYAADQNRSQAWEWITQAATEAMGLEDRRQKSYALHTLVLTALLQKEKQLVFPWQGPQLAETLITQMDTPRQRASAMHWLAASTPQPQERWLARLHNALQVPLEKKAERNKALIALYEQATAEGIFTVALDAAAGIEDESLQQKLLYQRYKNELAAAEYSHALAIAQRLVNQPAVSAWGKLARYYADAGEERRAQSARSSCYEAAVTTRFNEQPEALLAAAKYIADSMDADLARKALDKIPANTLKNFAGKYAKVEASVAKALAKQARFEEAEKTLEKIEDSKLKGQIQDFIRHKRDQKQKKKSQENAKQALQGTTKGSLEESVEQIIKTSEARLRSQQFRKLAEDEAKRKDVYGLLKGKSSHTAPALPDKKQLRISAQSLRSMMPLPGPFQMHRVYYENSYFINNKFLPVIEKSQAVLQGELKAPEVIFLERGTATLSQIHDGLLAQDSEDYLKRQGKQYTLRRPIVIGPDATLIIDGRETEELHLSKRYGVIIVNAGALHILDARVKGWDDEKGRPALAEYKDRHDFRPFIASWGGSRTYLGGSEFTALGYSGPKAYGISFTSGPRQREEEALYMPEPATGVITDNSFENMYYGFYSYEAAKVAIIGNEYRDSIVYGIDPHDRSRNLTIAYNTVHGSKQKHGIIISREVNDSSYIGNLCFGNHGSGFMIDRQSQGTYVYANTAFNNRQDGLTLFESNCNLIAANEFFNNGLTGIRLRNSRDNQILSNQLARNKQAGIYGYTSELRKIVQHIHRDFLRDPYVRIASASLTKNRIEENGVGVKAEAMDAVYLHENQFVNQAPKLFQGELFSEDPYLAVQAQQSKGVWLERLCAYEITSAYDCRFNGKQVQKKPVSKPACHEQGRS